MRTLNAKKQTRRDDCDYCGFYDKLTYVTKYDKWLCDDCFYFTPSKFKVNENDED